MAHAQKDTHILKGAQNQGLMLTLQKILCITFLTYPTLAELYFQFKQEDQNT